MSKNCYSLTRLSDSNKYSYNRVNHLFEEKVRDLLGSCYNVPSEHVCLATSGIEVIAMLIQNILININFQEVNLIYGNELYCDTPLYFQEASKMYGCIESYSVNVTRNSEIEGLFRSYCRDQYNILFLESCSNPSGQIMDFSLISQLHKLSRKLIVIIDNTWTTHVSFNPLQHGADFAVSSLSKHYSDGQCIGGVIVSKDNNSIMKQIQNYKRITGNHFCLPYCQILLKTIPTMEDKIKSSTTKIQVIAFKLSNHPKILELKYPLFSNHESQKLLQKYFKYPPDLLIFQVNKPKTYVKKWLEGFKLIPSKTSFGSSETKIDPWVTSKDKQTTWCRLSVGYDSNEQEIIKELFKQLDRL